MRQSFVILSITLRVEVTQKCPHRAITVRIILPTSHDSEVNFKSNPFNLKVKWRAFHIIPKSNWKIIFFSPSWTEGESYFRTAKSTKHKVHKNDLEFRAPKEERKTFVFWKVVLTIVCLLRGFVVFLKMWRVKLRDKKEIRREHKETIKERHHYFYKSV